MIRGGPPSAATIAVDIGALGPDSAGIGRYIEAMLPALMRASGATIDWRLWGRRDEQVERLGLAPFVGRWDRMPRHLGRVAALGSSLPWWLARDLPDVYWGPAHRLPVAIPDRVACVVTIHDVCWARAPETMRPVTRVLDRVLMKRALARADRVIAVSHATASDLEAVSPQVRDKIDVVPAGFAPLPAAGDLEEVLPGLHSTGYFLFVGTMEPRKNLPRLLRAYARAAVTSGAGFPELVIAGGQGWGGEDIAALAEHLELGGRIRFLGRVSDETLATLYAHALCLTMPSLYEGFGLPLVEAMAFGTPVLTSNVSSMPEVAGEAGVLVDPMSIESIARGLTQMAGEPGLRNALAANTKAQAGQFTWDLSAARTIEVFERAISSRKNRGFPHAGGSADSSLR